MRNGIKEAVAVDYGLRSLYAFHKGFVALMQIIFLPLIVRYGVVYLHHWFNEFMLTDTYGVVNGENIFPLIGQRRCVIGALAPGFIVAGC